MLCFSLKHLVEFKEMCNFAYESEIKQYLIFCVYETKILFAADGFGRHDECIDDVVQGRAR
jgi:hypothetical protein